MRTGFPHPLMKQQMYGYFLDKSELATPSITQYDGTVYIGIPYIRILFIFTFNLKLISLLMISR